MSNLEIRKFAAGGPAESGLQVWPAMDPAGLESGVPVETGHEYFGNEELGLTAGVWHCTPFVSTMEPYPVDEFMQVLEGSVTIETEDGTETTIRAGECFVIPRGLVCKWKQSEDILKFYVIFDNPTQTTINDASSLKVIVPNGTDSVNSVELNDPSEFIGDIPVQHVHNYYLDSSKQFMVGLWDSEGFDRPVQPIDRCEFMCILDGSVTIGDGNGNDQVFSAGDALFVPKGAAYKWTSTEFVRKFYCIFKPVESVAASAAAE